LYGCCRILCCILIITTCCLADGPWSGSLLNDTTWTVGYSPYTVDHTLSVPNDVTLTIEPGVTVLFGEDAKITVYGRLIAEGTPDAMIHFTKAPGIAGYWDGLSFDHSMADNRISYALIEYGRSSSNGMVGVQNSRLTLDHCTLDHCDLRRMHSNESSLIVRYCTFTDIFGPDEPPSTDNHSEQIWGGGIPDDGWFIIEHNIFGKSKGHNDAIDFDGPSLPKPIPHILNNIFLGGGDDALDLESDALIEGNIFMNVIKDEYNKASGEANCLSAGAGKHYFMINNLFYNIQHVAQVKDGAFLTFINNTVVDTSHAAIYFDLDLPGRKPGRGANIENSIFYNVQEIFAGVVDTTDLTINNCNLPIVWHDYGTGNIEADPLFVDPNTRDYHLKSQAGHWDPNSKTWIQDELTSPCIDAGGLQSHIGPEPFPNGGIINMGAYGGTAEASKSWFDKPVCETIVAGDINGDCIVDFKDFAIIALHWLE